ncbi:hypothetical protein [Pseudomonas phage vB_PaS-HSN4]|nr:hypothetical protein [Pseudomonas phage vB_PaS-HSN4]
MAAQDLITILLGDATHGITYAPQTIAQSEGTDDGRCGQPEVQPYMHCLPASCGRAVV